ncbi:MAG: hypothetical protein RIQ89_1975, partial [Bacteroidota bacterium]
MKEIFKPLSISFFLIIYINVTAQDLTQIHKSVNNPYVKVTEMDAMWMGFANIDILTLDSANQQLLLGTYKLFSKNYAANAHFKQAYIAYDRMLDTKIKYLSAIKLSKIDLAQKALAAQQSQLEGSINEKESQISSLKSELDIADKNKKRFNRYLSIFTMSLIVIVAFILLRISIKLVQARKQLEFQKKE